MSNTHKFVNDLGLAAYILLHGYVILGKREGSIYFECDTDDLASEFDELILEFQPPNEFLTFDSNLMYLKKINERLPKNFNEETDKVVNDLGTAAYLLLDGYKDEKKRLGLRLTGKKGKTVYFRHPAERGEDFKRLAHQYVSSQFHAYDNNIMTLKKMGDYMPSSH